MSTRPRVTRKKRLAFSPFDCLPTLVLVANELVNGKLASLRFASVKAFNSWALCENSVRTNATHAQRSLIPVAIKRVASRRARSKDLQPIPIRHGSSLPRRERKRSPRARNPSLRGGSSEPSSSPRAERRSLPVERESPRWRGNDRPSRGRPLRTIPSRIALAKSSTTSGASA